MPDLAHRLAMMWWSHHLRNQLTVETNCGKLLYHLLLKRPRVGRPVSKKKLAKILPPVFGKQATRLLAYLLWNSEAPVYRLPTEVILEIAKNVTPHSRAYFSLSCKILLFVILDGISMVFDDLRLPAELPEEDPEEDAPYNSVNNWPPMYQPDN